MNEARQDAVSEAKKEVRAEWAEDKYSMHVDHEESRSNAELILRTFEFVVGKEFGFVGNGVAEARGAEVVAFADE